MDPSIQKVFDYYLELIHGDLDEYSLRPSSLCLPIVPAAILNKLCSYVAKLFESEPIVLTLALPLLVVGDLHGQIMDLFRILKRYGFPPQRRYLFLGDFVDRGEFSTEVVTIVLLMKVLWPNHVFIIRGNHEFTQLISSGGFSNELTKLYGSKNVESAFLHAFSYMPLCAKIGPSMFAVHGGIGPHITSLDDINNIKRPFDSFDDPLSTELLWSDPCEDATEFTISPRGIGAIFGPPQIQKFMDDNHFTLVIRGHECVEDGTEYACDKKVITVFSASNYCGLTGNNAGVLLLSTNLVVDPQVFAPCAYLRRNQTSFILSEKENEFIPVPLQPTETVPKKRSKKRGSQLTHVGSIEILHKIKKKSSPNVLVPRPVQRTTKPCSLEMKKKRASTNFRK